MPEEVSECPEALGPTLAENSALPIVEVYNLRFRTRDGNEFWAPVLVQDGELLRYPSAWLISAAQSNYSTSTLGSRAHALRRFAEYYGGLHAKVAASETESNPRAAALAVVRGFESALTRGPAELGWRPMPLRSARKLRMWFDMFCDWLVENSGFEPSDHPNPLVKGSKNTSIVQVENRIQRDMLGHLYTATMAFRDPEVRALDRHIPSWGRDISASAISVGEGGIDGEFAIGISVKSRPPMMSIDDYFVLLECCRSRRDWRGECLWLLLGAGCARVSEALNAYATDVHPCNGEAYVALANPVEGLINYHGEWISRRDFLKRRYGAIPRPMLPRDNPLRAGWKGMAINSIRCDEFADVANWANRGWALVEWLYPSFGEQFLYAWTQYRAELQNRGVQPDHPYLFVNLSDNVGAPMTRQNVDQLLESACEVAGIGVRRCHRLRHMYGGHCADIGISIQDTQVRMRHKSWLSTLVYFNMTKSVGRKKLRERDVTSFEKRRALARQFDKHNPDA